MLEFIFEKDFDNASTIRLEQNYRSTNNILKSASSLISYNSVRLGKELHSDQGNGDPIFIHQTNSDFYITVRRLTQILFCM